jgi:hypothetical protein
MKNKIFAFLLLTLFSFASLTTNSTLSSNNTLSNKEMAKLKGGGCPDVTTYAISGLLFIIGWITLDPVLIIIGGTVNVICTQAPNNNSGSGSSSGSGSDPCTNSGGGYDTFENCQSGGGRWLGDNCCQY